MGYELLLSMKLLVSVPTPDPYQWFPPVHVVTVLLQCTLECLKHSPVAPVSHHHGNLTSFHLDFP